MRRLDWGLSILEIKAIQLIKFSSGLVALVTAQVRALIFHLSIHYLFWNDLASYTVSKGFYTGKYL